MPTIDIALNEFVNAHILPKIDALARERSCTQSDVLRDIFYSSFEYSPSQIEADCEIEVSTERKSGKGRSITAVIDNQFYDILMCYWVGCRGTYHQAVRHILYNYFGEYPEGWSHKTINANEAELRVIARKTGQVIYENNYPNSL